MAFYPSSLFPCFRVIWPGDEDAGWRSFSVIVSRTLTGHSDGYFVGGHPQLTPIIAPGMSPDQLELLNYLVRIILPAQIFHFLAHSSLRRFKP